MEKFSKFNIPKGKFVEMSVKRFMLNKFTFFFCFCEAEEMI